MGMTSGLAKTELVDADGFATQPWQIFFRDFDAVLAQVPVREDVVQIPPAGTPPLNASLPVNSLGTKVLASGVYRVSAYVRIKAPAVTSSSVLVSLFWYDGGVPCTLTLVPAVTGNTTASVGQGAATIRIDGETEIVYSTTYLSVGANEMQYEISVVLERLGGQ